MGRGQVEADADVVGSGYGPHMRDMSRPFVWSRRRSRGLAVMIAGQGGECGQVPGAHRLIQSGSAGSIGADWHAGHISVCPKCPRAFPAPPSGRMTLPDDPIPVMTLA